MKIRNTIFGPGLWVVAAGASALSLGSGSGTVVLGSPVDLAFELQPDPGTDVASSCVTAKVVAGDNAIGDSKVRVIPLPEVRGRPSGVRVMASIALDEPVLTVTLTAGCAGKTTRTYTFLSDLPTIATRSASALPVDLSRLPVARGGEAATNPVTAQDSRAVPAPADRLATSQPPAPRGPIVARPAAPAPARPAARVPAPVKALAAGASTEQRPRLVLEPLDIWLDSPVPLRSSVELTVMPSEEMSVQRAQAIALWKSLNAQPETLLKDSEQLKTLESEATALRAQAVKDRAAAAQLQQQLELAEQERFPATIVYALGALLAMALLVVAWMWIRLRNASHKAVRAWGDSVALGARDATLAEEALGLAPHPGDSWLPSDTQPFLDEAPAPDGQASAVIAPVPGPASTASAPVPPPMQPVPTASPSSAAASASLHIVNPEELFDIQQQAEFFISVGEHQQAIEVLKNHIAEHRETSPLAYLELLQLYHTLSRVDEFAQLRGQFMQFFNAQVPEFSGFHRTGRMLYHYTDALADIEAEWTSPEVLALLEKLLFRRTGAEAVEPFDLAAYDDLLLLLSIAQTTPASARGEPPPRKRTTPLAPPRVETLVAESLAAPFSAAVALRQDDAPLDSLAASLEFDFGAMPPSPAPDNSTPVSTAPATIGSDSGDAALDLDLSEPVHLTLSDLPPVPVTPPPPSGQAVGFGMENDLMELRLELEQMKHKSDHSK
ncbi:hypothetical protein [Acidovorax sp. HMWF029]|uniref:hypothetical protein n=1 Tax=Acidovorax sp. HMWF029 TaxID=2056863 RepID=UPI001E2E09B3|nr:hypothetical protein [Acidovorax sp. HMWF029]